MYNEDEIRAIEAHSIALQKAYRAWPQTHPNEPWPGYFYMSPELRAELGIPPPPPYREPDPPPPHLDPASPEFRPPPCLHPSMLSEEARAKVQAQKAAIAEAEAVVTDSLDADFAAWEPEAEP